VGVIRPFAAQEPFLECGAREALYGGAAGPGKSFALLLDAAARIHLSHYRALLLRRTFPELEDTLIEKSKEIYPYLGGKYNESKHFWRFPSGAKISFGYLQREADLERYKGPEFQFIGIDELTTFPEKKFVEFLFSRLRSKHGIACYARFASNPGGPGHDWVFQRYAPWLWEPGLIPYPGPRTERGKVPRPRPGEIIWLRRSADGSEIVTDRDWHDTTCAKCAIGNPCIVHRPVARAYFPAKVQDNPFLAGTEYEANLHNLPPLERARLLGGDWNIMPAAGMYFQREKFGVPLATYPSEVIARVRYWDRAATEGGGDWTVGVRMSVLEGPRFVVEDVIRAQRGPGGVEQLIAQTADLDAPLGTITALEQDPGQAGKVEIFNYSKLLVGKAFVALPPQGNKLTRARPVSSQVYVGNVSMVSGPWNHPYLSVLEAYDGTENGVDDDVDATSGAFRVLLTEYHRRRRTGRKARVTIIGGHEPDADEAS
jgi:predicted phage terminase large subunit-like protein